MIALHGGGEFKRGDEPFLDALVAAAARHREASATDGHAVDGSDPLDVVIVPTAAAHERPKLAAAHGVAAFRRAAERTGLAVEATPLFVIDRSSAADSELAARLAAADIIHFPGGDPDLIPGTLEGTAAWSAIRSAVERGAVLAGASAGAMGLADRTWTPGGWRDGLRLVHGLIVVPHFEMLDLRAWEWAIEELDLAGLGRLGLEERTGVLSDGDGRTWQVVGQGRAHWFPVHGTAVVAEAGATIRLPD